MTSLYYNVVVLCLGGLSIYLKPMNAGLSTEIHALPPITLPLPVVDQLLTLGHSQENAKGCGLSQDMVEKAGTPGH